MSVSSGRIANLVGGRLTGRRDIELVGVAPLELAGPDDLSFIASSGHLAQFKRSGAGAVLVPGDVPEDTVGPRTRIVVSDVRAALARAITEIFPAETVEWGIEPSAKIGRGTIWSGRIAVRNSAVLGRDVKLGADCVIGEHAVVEDGAVIGGECRIGAHALVAAGVRLGDRVVLKPGARVGGAGFAFAASARGHIPIRHVGSCLLEDDVEVGANTTIDRGSIADTVVGRGTKIDNQVQIAHNVRIGSRCIIMAQAGLAGSTVLEEDVLLAGQAGLAGHLKVGKGARVAAQAGVIGDIAKGVTVSGYPARPHRDVLRQAAALKKLATLTSSLERIVERHGQE